MSFPNLTKFQEVVGEAEENFRTGLTTINHLSKSAQGALRDNPSAILTSVVVAGFLAGTLFRKKDISLKMKTDPLLLFAAGAVAGLAVGPQVFEKILGKSS